MGERRRMSSGCRTLIFQVLQGAAQVRRNILSECHMPHYRTTPFIGVWGAVWQRMFGFSRWPSLKERGAAPAPGAASSAYGGRVDEEAKQKN
jgi:hypothetical protein